MTRFILLSIASAVFFSCGVPEETSDPIKVEQIELRFEEPKGEIQNPIYLEEETRFGSENREAVMVILKGFLNQKKSGKPFHFEIQRVISGDLYRDHDDEIVPNRFITHAEVLDNDGKVIWEENIDSLLQILDFLKVVINKQSPIKLSVKQVFKFVETQYPQLLEFGILVPTKIPGGVTYRVTFPNDDGEMVEVLNVEIADLLKDAKPSELKARVKTIIDNGKPADKIDIVIMGDGYKSENETEFNGDAKAVAEKLFETEPFKSHANDFNIHTAFMPSKEKGAGYDCSGDLLKDRGCKNALRDTVFETTFVVSALADKLDFEVEPAAARAAMPLQNGKIFDLSTKVPSDQILIISNTDRFSGFAGLYFAVVTAYDARKRFPQTAVHELGHSFGLLGDEYSAESDACLANEPRIPLPVNIASSIMPLKWKDMVDEGAPIPTPISQAESVSIGAFEGAYSCEGFYRPSATCKMRNSEHEFCGVCAQQLVKRITTTIDAISSEGVQLKKTKTGFELRIDDIVNRDIEIKVDGKEINHKEGVAQILDSELKGDWMKIEVKADMTSEYLVRPIPNNSKEVSLWMRRVTLEK